jgi:hypothetical protein
MQMRCQDRNAPNKPGSEFIPPYDLSAEPAEMMDRRMSNGSKGGDISAQQEIKPEGQCSLVTMLVLIKVAKALLWSLA